MNKISAPTPLLNYTLRYNMLKDAMELSKVRDIATDKDLEKEKETIIAENLKDTEIIKASC